MEWTYSRGWVLNGHSRHPATLRRPDSLEHHLCSELKRSRMVGERSVRISESGCAGDQEARPLRWRQPNIVELARSELGMIHQVVSESAELDAEPVPERESLHEAHIEVIDGVQTDAAAPASRESTRSGPNELSVRIVHLISHDLTLRVPQRRYPTSGTRNAARIYEYTRIV